MLRAQLQRHRLLLSNVRPTGRRIGTGSYGTVEEVEVEGLLCAAKRLHETLVERESQGRQNILGKFEEECLLLSELRHPHIVQFLGVCFLDASDLPVLVMEYLPYCLDNLLEEGRVEIPLAIKWSILVDVARGLTYLHARPVIHRDLTAKNVLLTAAMTAKVADLGVARILNLSPGRMAATMTQAPGTQAYMPPEALEAKPKYDTAIDIFSFGHLTLFTVVQDFPYPIASTRLHPKNPKKVIRLTEVQRRLHQMDQFSHQLGGEKHPLVQLVTQCLHNDPKKRPSARKVLSQLEGMKASIGDQHTGMSRLEGLKGSERPIVGLHDEVSKLQGKLQVTVKELDMAEEGHTQRHHSGEQSHTTAPPAPVPRGGVPSQGSELPGPTKGREPLAYVHPPGLQPQLHVQLSIGSTVQLSDPPRYGVIRWIGELPRIEGLVAGVELEEAIEGGCDGTWPDAGEKYFDCNRHKGLFLPLYSLRLDKRFTAPGSTPGSTVLENPLNDVQYEVEEDAHIDPHPRQIEKYLGERRGIQGHHNSCYLDATVFGLFALSDAFDEVFLKQPEDVSGKEICDMFWKGIVNPLRLKGVVRYESVMAMRNKLEEIGKMKGVNHSEKDPEEFLNMLFKYTLDVKPFISIKRPFGVEKEFFVQLFVELDEREPLPTVGSLLIKMFKEQNISFTQVPSRLLIQVPRYGTKFKTYQKLLPALELDVSEVVDVPTTKDVVPCYICEKPGKYKCSSCTADFQSKEEFSYFCESCTEIVHSQRTGHAVIPVKSTGPRVSESESIPLELLSVICIETSHYVCFARSEDRWVFFDSMANRIYDAYNIPKGVDCTKELKEWVYCRDHRRLLNTPPRELPEYVRRFVQDVYMCVYIQPDVGMVG